MRVLVIPTSKHGGTAEIGRAIATVLRKHGIDVDVSQPEHMFTPGDYDGYIIGSAIYLGDWIDRARSFVDQHAEVISRKPTWLFSSGPLGDSMPETPIQPEVVEHLMAATGAREHRLFGGRIQYDKLSRPERFLARWVGVPEDDHRDWDDIEQWASSIGTELRADLRS